MKKLDFKKIDHSYVKICLYLFFLAAAVILFEKVIGHLPHLGNMLKTVGATLGRLGSPFLIGFAIAYLMNPITKFFEYHLLRTGTWAKTHPRLVRAFCILANYVIVIGGLVWIMIYLIPELKNSVVSFVAQLPSYSTELNSRILTFFNQVDFINAKDVTALINRFMAPFLGIFENIPKLISDIAFNLYSVGKLTIDVIMAIFISFYMLYDKESFSKQVHKIVYALTSPTRSETFFSTINRINNIFQNFIVGKALDSLIIGILAFVGFSFLNAPFALVLSLIIGVTNMIPYFGPFIGAIPAAIITFLVSPLTAVWVLLFILALQQFDGNFLGPKILGNSLDLSPIWIILAVVVGGAALGPLGMFIGVPILATIKMFSSEYISKRYTEKYAAEDPLNLLPKDKPNTP